MSSLVPSVVVTRAWVSPRVKMAEPWVRGRTPTSIQISRIWSKARAVGTALVVDDLVAEDAFAQGLVVLLKLRLALVVFRGHGLQQLFFESADQFVALRLGMLLGVEAVRQAGADLRFQFLVVGLVELGRGHFALGLPGFLAQLVDGGADLLDLGVGELDGVHHRLFFHFLGAGLDHHDAVGGADHHDVEQAFAHFARRSG